VSDLKFNLKFYPPSVIKQILEKTGFGRTPFEENFSELEEMFFSKNLIIISDKDKSEK
jgi:hypothetical protein